MRLSSAALKVKPAWTAAESARLMRLSSAALKVKPAWTAAESARLMRLSSAALNPKPAWSADFTRLLHRVQSLVTVTPIDSVADLTDVLDTAEARAALRNVGPATVIVRGQIPGFHEAAHALLDDVGLRGDEVDLAGDEVDLDEVAFAPSDDDRAYEAIHQAAPVIADAVDAAAASVKTPFWSTRAVRNALAWMLVSLAVTGYVLGAVLPQPWGTILSTVLGLSGVSAVDAYKLAAPTARDLGTSDRADPKEPKR